MYTCLTILLSISVGCIAISAVSHLLAFTIIHMCLFHSCMLLYAMLLSVRIYLQLYRNSSALEERLPMKLQALKVSQST